MSYERLNLECTLRGLTHWGMTMVDSKIDVSCN